MTARNETLHVTWKMKKRSNGMRFALVQIVDGHGRKHYRNGVISRGKVKFRFRGRDYMKSDEGTFVLTPTVAQN